jgi:hypothetical protein
MIMRRLVASAVLMMAAVPASAATVLFSQNFDSLPVGVPAASVPGFNVTGTVDVVADNSFGIRCVGNAGKCLDIDGTPGPGSLASNSIAFAAARKVTVSFDVSGNQRNQTSDEFRFNFSFGAPTDMNQFSCSSGFTLCASGNFPGFTASGVYSETIAGSRPWVSYSMSFTPGQAGAMQLFFSSTSADFIGPMLDNVVVTQAAVPEPASWAMLIAGFGLVGAARRRQRLAGA